MCDLYGGAIGTESRDLKDVCGWATVCDELYPVSILSWLLIIMAWNRCDDLALK